MKVEDVMTARTVVVSPDASLMSAAKAMRDAGVGILPVVADERFGGMVSDRDIVVRAVADGRDPRTTTVHEVMTHEVFFCREDQPLEEAARIMEEKAVRRLAVLDREGELVGILSIDDIAMVLGDEELAGEILARVVEPAPSER